MPRFFTRRSLFQASGAFAISGLIPLDSVSAWATPAEAGRVRVNFNENAWGPSVAVRPAIEHALAQISRYGDAAAAQALVEQIAAYERVSPEQVIPGEILVALGFYLGTHGGPGGEFLYSTPGYLALIDAARNVGGVGIGVPLNAAYENDLAGIAERITPRTRAIFLVNPHNPTGTVNEPDALLRFAREASRHALVIVDEAYLDYVSDFAQRSAVSLVREGANVLVFRTFDKIHGLAGLPIGYALVPREIGKALRAEGLGDAESLGRINIAAASAALADTDHVARVRAAVLGEREKWNAVLDELKLRHTASHANFIFFDGGRPHNEIASAFAARGVDVARVFPPFDTWIRITIGLPEENLRVQQVLRGIFARA